MNQRPVNAVVVGAGAGGGIVAKELSVAGMSVVLLERGDWVRFEQHDHDELFTRLGFAYGPDDRHPRVAQTAPGEWTTVGPTDRGYSNNAACVGSGTVFYGAMAWRFMEQDFKMRSTYGAPENSTLEDWPISYADLEPFYEKAEWEIGVSGDMSANPFSPVRRKPYPMPPFPYNREGRILESAAKRLGFHPFPIPMLRNSVSHGGRNACIGCRYCVGFACEINAKGGSHNTVIPTALGTGNCELRTNVMVSEVVVDEQGRARGVRYFDANDRAHWQPSDLVVVAGGAIETARLLLNSKSRLFPNGAGNRHDWVGRNLQGHSYCGAEGHAEEETYDDVGAGATIAISDFNHGNPGLCGGAMLCNGFIVTPYSYTKVRPPGAAQWGKAHKDHQRRYFKRRLEVHGPVQEIPVFESRVQVDPVIRDHWGIPVARVAGRRHPHVIEVARFLEEKAGRWVREAGATGIWTRGPRGELGAGGQHQAGTCRIGDVPKTSVTNRYGQVHEIDNLFIADGSLHVTNGGFNPALTIMALGYWVGHHIVRAWQGGGLR